MTVVEVSDQWITGLLDILQDHSMQVVEIVSADNPQARIWITADRRAVSQDPGTRAATSTTLPLITSPASRHPSISHVLARQGAFNSTAIAHTKPMTPHPAQPIEADVQSTCGHSPDISNNSVIVEGSDDGGINDEDMEALLPSPPTVAVPLLQDASKPKASINVSETPDFTETATHLRTSSSPLSELTESVSTPEAPIDETKPPEVDKAAVDPRASSPLLEPTESSPDNAEQVEGPIQLISTIGDGPTRRRLKKARKEKEQQLRRLAAEQRVDVRRKGDEQRRWPIQVAGRKRHRLSQGRRSSDEDAEDADHESDTSDEDVVLEKELSPTRERNTTRAQEDGEEPGLSLITSSKRRCIRGYRLGSTPSAPGSPEGSSPGVRSSPSTPDQPKPSPIHCRLGLVMDQAITKSGPNSPLRALSDQGRRKMIRHALMVGDRVALEEIQSLFEFWRDRGTRCTAIEAMVYDGSQRVLRGSLANFLRLYNAALCDSAHEKVNTLSRRLQLSRLYKEYESAREEQINNIEQGQGVTNSASAKIKLFFYIYFPTEKYVSKPATHPMTKKAWGIFTYILRKAAIWSTITDKLGAGSLCLIPHSIADSFFEKDLAKGLMAVWLDMVIEANKGLEKFSLKWSNLFPTLPNTTESQYPRVSYVKEGLPARPLHLERLELTKQHVRTDLSTLLDDSDDGRVSVIFDEGNIDLGHFTDPSSLIPYENNYILPSNAGRVSSSSSMHSLDV